MRRSTVVAGLIAGALALGACGDDEEPVGIGVQEEQQQPAEQEQAPAEEGQAAGDAQGDQGTGTLELAADPTGQLLYAQERLTTEAGPLVLQFVNRSRVPHNVVIERDGEQIAATEVITNDTETLETTLEPGEYTYFCSVGNHRQAGMEGTLIAR